MKKAIAILLLVAAAALMLCACGGKTGKNNCTGSWKCVDIPETMQFKTVTIEITDTSFTYTHPTPAAYRKLEWQWVEPLTILPSERAATQLTASECPTKICRHRPSQGFHTRREWSAEPLTILPSPAWRTSSPTWLPTKRPIPTSIPT